MSLAKWKSLIWFFGQLNALEGAILEIRRIGWLLSNKDKNLLAQIIR